jgi:hypothetical protein
MGCLLLWSQAVSTWDAPPTLAESKPYAIAIYNIVIIGGVAYFLGGFVSTTSISTGVALEITGLFLCPNISVVVIMIPKLLGMKGYISAKGMMMSSVPESSMDERRSQIESCPVILSPDARLDTRSDFGSATPQVLEGTVSLSLGRSLFHAPVRVVPTNAYETSYMEPLSNHPDCDVTDL